MKILLAPWGDPTRWKEIKYTFGSDPSEISISPLKLLSKKYDVVILLVLDSLIDINPDKESMLFEDYNKTIMSKVLDSYDKIVDSVTSFASCVAKRIGILNCEVVVLPSFGSPGGNKIFKGSPGDYLSIGMLKITKILEKCEEIEEISTDLSNGLNYTTALSLKMAEMISDLELMRQNSIDRIVTNIYNSDPYTGESSRDMGHEIRLVYKEIKNKIIFPYLSIKEESSGLFKKTSSAVVDLKNVEIEYQKYIPNILKSLYFSLPLVLFNYFGKEYKEPILETWQENIKIEGESIMRILSLNPNKVYAILFSNIVLRKISSPATIMSLKSITKDIYPKISASSQALIEKELNSLSKALTKLKERGKEEDFYVNLSGNEEYFNQISNKVEPDMRNLIAHAGFQNNFIKINKSGKISYTIPIEDLLAKIS
jgi:CRISPR-associated protein Csx1